MKIRICITIIFFLLFYVGVKLGSTLREACKPSILENRVLSELFGTTKDGGNCVNWELHDLCILPGTIIIIESVRIGWVDGWDMRHSGGRRKIHAEFS